VNLTEWARWQGGHAQTAYRWFREVSLPVPAVWVNQRTVLVNPGVAEAGGVAVGGVGLYVRVCSHDQRADLDREVAQLSQWAAQSESAVVGVGVGDERVAAQGAAIVG
jgi:putative resolvase